MHSEIEPTMIPFPNPSGHNLYKFPLHYFHSDVVYQTKYKDPYLDKNSAN